MLINLISFTIIMSITPGPNNIICMGLGTKNGYSIAMKYIIGICAGCMTMLWIMLLLNTIIADILPTITNVISYVGAIYMCYLAYKFMRFDSTKTSDDSLEVRTLGFKEGLIMQYINPKAYIFNMTIVSGFLSKISLNPLNLTLLSLLMACIFFCCCSTWALFGHSFKGLFSKYGRILNLTLGGTLIYLAISILLH